MIFSIRSLDLFDTLSVSLDPSVSPQTNSISPTLPPLLTPLCNDSKIVSTRGWSVALPKKNQSFPTPEDV